MASTVLSDVIVPEVFARYVFHLSTERSALIRAGVISPPDARINALVRGGGRTFNLPHWNYLANTEANVASDAQTEATPENIGTLQDIAVRHNRNQHWGAMDLVDALSGEDTMGAIASQVADYWVRQDQLQYLSTWKGCIAAEASLSTGAAVTGTINLAAVLDAMQLLGDAKDRLTAIIMHSRVHTTLQKNQEIITTPPNATDIGFGTYAGLTVVVDDGMPQTSGTPNREHVWLVGAGSTAWGESPPKRPAAVTREELRGHGGGEEILSSRRQYVMHPRGMAWQDATVTAPGQSPTNANLEVAGNWSMVYDRKNVVFAELLVDEDT